MKVIYSEEAKGTDFREGEGAMWRSDTWSKTYTGQWDFTQFCYLEHRPEV
jgi:hypothetical protein